MSAALELDMSMPGFGGCVVTIEEHDDGVRIVVDVDDPHYSGERVLTAEQLATLRTIVGGRP